MAAAGAVVTRASPARLLAGWGVHVLTASSGPAGLLALLAITRGDAPGAFWFMAWALAIDAVDGTLARAVGVKIVIPSVDGTRLDDLMDYVTYVIVPAFFVVEMHLAPPALAVPVACSLLLASAYGFAQTTAKTTDHFFTGFPSYWNVVALYLYVWALPSALNAVILAVLAGLVFVPIRYVYPSRTMTLARTTLVLATAWTLLLLVVISRLPAMDGPWARLSLVFPLYYIALSLWLHGREATTHHQITRSTDTSPDHHITR